MLAFIYATIMLYHAKLCWRIYIYNYPVLFQFPIGFPASARCPFFLAQGPTGCFAADPAPPPVLVLSACGLADPEHRQPRGGIAQARALQPMVSAAKKGDLTSKNRDRNSKTSDFLECV
jgi:hypothetical protein